MKITTYLENHDAHARKNTLIEISMTRVLTENERNELNKLIIAINDFENEML